LVQWKSLDDKDSERYTQVPIDGVKGISVLPDEHIENISDMLFYLMGVNPPKVRRSKVADASELIRLSFKNILLFWYLDQDNIDSSFFYLEEKTGFHKNPSKDVMRMVLGYYYETIASLESELASLQLKRRGLGESITQLQSFLTENDIADTIQIDDKINALLVEKSALTVQRQEQIKGISISKTHVSDDIRVQVRKYAQSIGEAESAIEDITKQIELKRQLKEEYLYAGIKYKNLSTTRDLLKDYNFQVCPQCGLDVQQVEGDNICYLCHRALEEGQHNHYEAIDLDLRERQTEIDNSIQMMLAQKEILTKKSRLLLSKKQELDRDLSAQEVEYDSLYLAAIKHLDKSIDMIDAEIKYFEKIKPLPQKIDNLYRQKSQKEKEELEKKAELDKARSNADKQDNRLDQLKKLFLEILIKVKFPDIQSTDTVYMTTHDFYPRIVTKDNDISEIDFLSLSSGGKKTIYKACFAFAIQQLLLSSEDSISLPFPNVLIIDTPMKNISERENRDIFNSFYEYVYDSLQNELKDLQLIIVDKELYSPPESFERELISKHMTPDEPDSPGLINYYRGH